MSKYINKHHPKRYSRETYFSLSFIFDELAVRLSLTESRQGYTLPYSYIAGQARRVFRREKAIQNRYKSVARFQRSLMSAINHSRRQHGIT